MEEMAGHPQIDLDLDHPQMDKNAGYLLIPLLSQTDRPGAQTEVKKRKRFPRSPYLNVETSPGILRQSHILSPAASQALCFQ